MATSTAMPLSAVPHGFLDANASAAANLAQVRKNDFETPLQNGVAPILKNGFEVPLTNPINPVPKNGFENPPPHYTNKAALSKPEKPKRFRVPQCSTQVWTAFQSILRHDQEDEAWWWHATGPFLALMMEAAGTSIEGQAAGLLFHSKWVLAALGPRPTIYGNPVFKRDFMMDDLSPLEFSWAWDDPSAKPDSKPKVRYCVVGAWSDAEMEAWPVRAGQKFIDSVRPSFPGINWTWVDGLKDAWDEEASKSENVPGQEVLSTKTDYMGGFELDEMNVNMRGYMRAPRILTTRLGVLPTITHAVRSLEAKGAKFPAFDRLTEFVTSDPIGKTLTVIERPAIAVDCVDPKYARLKLYVWSYDTTFVHIMRVLNLGEENTPLTPIMLTELFPLWKSVFGLPDDFSIHDKLPEVPGEYPGLLYNFEFRAGSPSLSPKLYIASKHYGISDGCVAYGLTNYLRHRGRGKYANAFLDLIQGMCAYKSLGSTRGVQTYIQAGFTKTGSLSLTSYLSPQIYHKHNWVDED